MSETKRIAEQLRRPRDGEARHRPAIGELLTQHHACHGGPLAILEQASRAGAAS